MLFLLEVGPALFDPATGKAYPKLEQAIAVVKHAGVSIVAVRTSKQAHVTNQKLFRVNPWLNKMYYASGQEGKVLSRYCRSSPAPKDPAPPAKFVLIDTLSADTPYPVLMAFINISERKQNRILRNGPAPTVYIADASMKRNTDAAWAASVRLLDAEEFKRNPLAAREQQRS